MFIISIRILECKIPMLLLVRSHGLRNILTLLKPSGLILQFSKGTGLPVVARGVYLCSKFHCLYGVVGR